MRSTRSRLRRSDKSMDLKEEFPIAPADYLFYLLLQGTRRRDARLDGVLIDAGLNIMQWRIIAIIRRITNCTMKELALYTAVDRTTLSRAIDRLAAQGLVERSSAGRDRRQVNLLLTAQGEAAYGRNIARLIDDNRALTAGIDDQALRATAHVLQRIVANLMGETPETHDVLGFGDRLAPR